MGGCRYYGLRRRPEGAIKVVHRNMFNVGAGEIALIMVAALLLLGPKRLPELARGLGKFLREFRRQTDEVRTMVEREFYQMDQEFQKEEAPPGAVAAPKEPGTILPPSVAAASPSPAEASPDLYDAEYHRNADHDGEMPNSPLANSTDAPALVAPSQPEAAPVARPAEAKESPHDEGPAPRGQ